MSAVLPVFGRTIRESWRGVMGWTLGVAAVLLLYLPLFPSFGYVQSTFYGLLGFLLLTIAAVLWGSAAIAGLFAGALTGRRAWATGVAAGVAVLGYVFQAVAKQSKDLEWLNLLSPYAWVYHRPPLMHGVDVGGLLLAWGIALVLAAASAWALSRRDLRG